MIRKFFALFSVTALAGCSLPVKNINLGSGGLPGDIAIPSSNGVTGYECQDLSVGGRKFEFTLDAGSPTQKSFAESMCSCLRAGSTQADAEKAFKQIDKYGVESWGAKGALAVVGVGIKRCERAARQGAVGGEDQQGIRGTRHRDEGGMGTHHREALRAEPASSGGYLLTAAASQQVV